jgi:indole-3-glycerol phosphate synthase
MLAIIHDSNLIEFMEGHTEYIEMVRERMQIPITVKGVDGLVRTYTVPAAAKAGKDNTGAYRWSETE